jgi:hypothetical protein
MVVTDVNPRSAPPASGVFLSMLRWLIANMDCVTLKKIKPHHLFTKRLSNPASL